MGLMMWKMKQYLKMTKTTMCLNLNLEVLYCQMDPRQATCKEDTTVRKLCLKMTKTTMCLNLNLEVLQCRQATCKEDTTMRKLCLKMTERRFHLSLEVPCLKKVPEDLQDHLGISEEEDIDLNQLQNNAPKEKNVLQMPEEKTRKAVLLVVGGMLAKHIHCVFILTTLDATTHGDQIPSACMD